MNKPCIGCDLCAGTCPGVFAMTDEGTARALDREAEGTAAASAGEALNSCPASAIEKV